MPTIEDLQPFISEPREDLSVEYKGWLNLSSNEHRAVLAKAVIALANHGGGFVVLGMIESGQTFQSQPRPDDVPEITQDAVNGAVRRYATPEFHCGTYNVPHPTTGVLHPIVSVPGTLTEPVMSRRDCPGVIAQNRCYIRKPGPRSEEPLTGEEWRTLLSRCVRAGREEMLESIRTIVSGRVELSNLAPDLQAQLQAFCDAARDRWQELIADLPPDSPSRFPRGHYEMAFSLDGAEAARSLGDLQDRLQVTRQLKLTGWTPFLELHTPEWAPYPHEDFVEAWVGRPVPGDQRNRDPSLCDFWRASRDGKLFTMRGYAEDRLEGRVAGNALDITLPVWRVGEGLLFASRLAEQFGGVDRIAVRCRFTGLNGRQLISVTGLRAMFGDRASSTNEITLTTQATTLQIQDNLAEVIHGLLVSVR